MSSRGRERPCSLWLTGRGRLLITGALVAALVLGLVQPATTQARPARMGTILSGVFTTAPALPCQALPDCLPWLQSGCNPALAGRDPAWLSSIVDVHALADGTTPRTLVIQPGSPDGVILGGAFIQFWSGRCTEIRRAAWHTFWDCGTDDRREVAGRPKSAAGYECEVWRDPDRVLPTGEVRVRLPVPRGAGWMTISANDNVNIRWALV